jgi:hypothetical protein
MEIETGARFVAHYDMLGMSALVQQDLQKAWGAIHQLDDDRERILDLVIEVSDQKQTTGLPLKHYIRDQLRSFTFSDPIVMYSVADDEASLRAVIYLCNEIFARALHRRIPLRGGIAHGSGGCKRSGPESRHWRPVDCQLASPAEGGRGGCAKCDQLASFTPRELNGWFATEYGSLLRAFRGVFRTVPKLARKRPTKIPAHGGIHKRNAKRAVGALMSPARTLRPIVPKNRHSVAAPSV